MPHSNVVAGKMEQVLNNEVYCDVFSESTIESKTDLGNAFVYRANHPEHGKIILVDSGTEKYLMIRV